MGAIEPPTAPWPAKLLPAERRRLGLLILLLPLLMALGGWIGYRLHPVLAAGHPAVALAEQVRLWQSGKMTERTDEIRAWEASGKPAESLWPQEAAVLQKFSLGGLLAGIFVGFAAGVKLIQVSIHRVRKEYQANRAGCLACGRCFAFCPRQQMREKARAAEKKQVEG